MSVISPAPTDIMAPNAAPTIADLNGDSITLTENVNNQPYLDALRNATVTDPDSGNFNGGRLTVAITTGLVASADRILVQQEGNITLSGQAAGSTVSVNGFVIGTLGQFNIGTNTQTITFTTDDATAARVQLLIRAFQFVGNGENPVSGTRTIAWTLVDGDGVANGGADTATAETTVVVIGINDAPAGTDSTRTINEDQPVALTAANFGFDQHGGSTASEGQVLQAVIVTTLPTPGTLYLDPDGAGTGSLGAAVIAGQSVSAADIAAGRLVYVPAANASGAGYASFTFQVQDSGGTANGGQDTDQSPNTLTFDVTAVNDAPTVTITPAPTLGGMGMITEWTDLETGSGELPASPWGTSDVDGANRIGLSVTFENGLAGSVIYDNVSGLWNSYFGGVAYESATGFFTAAQGLHFLFADGSTLPMAWDAFEMPFSGNFDLDYNNQNGSHFRADVGGWTSAVFRTFSSTAAGGGAGSYAATEQQVSSLKGTIALADVDAGGGVVTATLAVGYGVLDVGVGASGATVVSGNGTGSVVVSGTLAQLNALLGSDATSTVSFIPNTDAPPASTTLTVTVNDGGNTGGAAQTGSDSETIAITAINDAPVADLNGAEGGIDAAASYTEDTGAVKLAPGIMLSDADSATLTGATVTIASGFVAGDVVRVGNGQSGTTADGIAYSYNGATGVLTLSGGASVAAYQAALATLAFKTNSNTPGTARDIVVTVTDGAATSTAAHVALTVIPVNDAPTIANLQGDVSTFTEGDGAFTTSLDVGLNALASDPDNANFNGGSLNIAVTGGVAAEDFIYFNNGNPAFGLTFSGNTISQGGVAFATFNAPGADRTFTFLSDGSATPARVEQLIRSLTYHNSNQANPSEGAHTVTYKLTDGSGGASFTTATVNVVAVNDMPGVDLNGPGSGIDTAASYTEGASGVKLAPSVVVSDPDGTLTGASATIASGFVAGDILRLSGGQNGTTSDGIAFSYNGATGVLTLSGSASVAAYQAALATLGFKSNSTDPGPSRDVVVTVTDGSLTSAAAHVTVTITEVADAPAASAFSFAALPEFAATGDYGLSMFAEEETPASAAEFAFVSGEQGDFANPAILFDPAFADLML